MFLACKSAILKRKNRYLFTDYDFFVILIAFFESYKKFIIDNLQIK
tara:strand:+ start:583 stop:720 length:138 start_codon:yes stop_codon:yes gene_type:complete